MGGFVGGEGWGGYEVVDGGPVRGLVVGVPDLDAPVIGGGGLKWGAIVEDVDGFAGLDFSGVPVFAGGVFEGFGIGGKDDSAGGLGGGGLGAGEFPGEDGLFVGYEGLTAGGGGVAGGGVAVGYL